MGKKVARVIAVCNEKGGVGKTTTVCNLSAGLRRKGYKTLMIDLDSQMSLSKSLYAVNEEKSIVPVMAKLTPIQEVIQVVAQGDIISGRRTINVIDLVLNEADKQFALKEALQPIITDYDFILLDCPPSLSTITLNALVSASEVVIPTEAKTLALKGVQEVINTIGVIKERYNPELKIAGILITRYNGRAILSQDVKTVLEQMAAEVGTKVFKHPIRSNQAIADSQAYLTDIFAYSKRSNGAEDYGRLVDEIIG